MRNLRVFFLSGSIVLSIIILIIAFQNIQAQCNFITFFFFPIEQTTSPTIMIFIVSLIGMLAGIFYMGFLMSFLSREEEDDEF
jgi:uncharacterized integral membrane protein